MRILYSIGADKVIPEEFETSIELFDRVLSKMLVPRKEINTMISRYQGRQLRNISGKRVQVGLVGIKKSGNIEITAIRVSDKSPVIGKSLVELQLRNNYGVTIAALFRKKELFDNPDPETIIAKGDLVYLMGKSEQIANASELFVKRSAQSDNFVEN